MSDLRHIDVWMQLYEQTPLVVRIALGALSLGVVSLWAWIWRRQERAMNRIEYQMHARMDREYRQLREEIHSVRGDLQVMNEHLFQIAQNTRGNHDT